MDKNKLELKADCYAMSVVGNLDLDTMIEGEIGITIAEAYKQGYIDRDTENMPFETPTEFFSGCIPRIDAERKLGIIDYTYDPNRKPDWSVHLTALELEKCYRIFGIKLSETPSMEDYERAAKELSEKMRGVMGDYLFDDLDKITKAHADTLKAKDAELRLANCPKLTINPDKQDV